MELLLLPSVYSGGLHCGDSAVDQRLLVAID